MTKKYRSELTKMGSSGGSPSRWEHFQAVQYILQGEKKIERSPIESTDFSTMTDVFSDESQIPAPSTCSRKRRSDQLNELLEVEKKKLAVMERMVEDSNKFQDGILAIFENRKNNTTNN
ncbi:uncharacterized protein [Drosophila kikkawai]|uniref:Uncharacterized protein n=1 Tax=Drosophila kikkawai TaxID=30033 RepID=A0A6P4JRM9_DROKI